jgi:lipopolysaccharide heptosyltransferase I
LKILLVRTSAMGDVVHALPVLSALKKAWPAARVGWVIEAAWAPILADHPDLDAIIQVRTKAWRRRLLGLQTRAEMRRAVDAMRAFGADVALDLMGNYKGALLARRSGTGRSLGPSAPFRRERGSARLIDQRVDTPGEHAVDRGLALLAALDVPAALRVEADFGGDKLLRHVPAAAGSLCVEIDADPRPLVLIQLGAGWANKAYPASAWAAVARRLHADGCRVLLPTSPGEEALARTVAELSAGAAQPVDATDFATLAALQRRSRLVIGGDTGPLHLAHALGASVLCLIGPTDPRRNGPYGAVDRVIFHELPCSRCYKRFDGPRACLLSIAPAEVIDRARRLLAGG